MLNKDEDVVSVVPGLTYVWVLCMYMPILWKQLECSGLEESLSLSYSQLYPLSCLLKYIRVSQAPC